MTHGGVAAALLHVIWFCFRLLSLGSPGRVEAFQGRRDELFALVDMVRQFRAVTLLGPSGMGKTALARELALYLLERQVPSSWVFFFSRCASFFLKANESASTQNRLSHALSRHKIIKLNPNGEYFKVAKS